MEFEVDQVPEKLSTENGSAMAVDQDVVEAEKPKENPDQSSGNYFPFYKLQVRNYYIVIFLFN